MELMKYFFRCVLLSSNLLYSSSRFDNYFYNKKTVKKCISEGIVYKKRMIKCFGKKGGRPYTRPGGYGWHTSPISGNPLEGNGTGNNFFDSLASMAPIAIAMYCFNSAPRLTMVTLTTLLLFIAGSANE